MEYRKMKTEGLEGNDLAIAEAFNANVDKGIALEAQIKELEKRSDNSVEMNDVKTQLENVKKEILEVRAQKQAVTTEYKSFKDSMVAEIRALGVNTVSELKEYLSKNGTKTLEIRAISPVNTGNNSDTVGRTNLDMTIAWAPTRKNAFLGEFRVVAEQSNKSKFGYMEGSYTGTAAYVGEGTGNGNSDAASAQAYFMDYAKVQAVLSVNTEVYEDLPDFADGLINQMQIATSKFVDDEAYTGDGLAPAGVQHIKGLSTYATAAAFGVGGNMNAYAASVKSANVSDLAAAVKSYIDNLEGNYVADVCYMNPVDFFKMARLKDTTNQPLFGTDMFGNPVLAGLRVKTSAKITANTMLILDSNVVEWRTKRSMTLRMGQLLANDALNDKQSALLSARYQLLVRTADQKAVIKVTSVSDAVTAITAA